MKKKEVCVKTKRMMIQMMTDEEIDNLIETSGSDELRTAYREMLSGCKHDSSAKKERKKLLEKREDRRQKHLKHT